MTRRPELRIAFQLGERLGIHDPFVIFGWPRRLRALWLAHFRLEAKPRNDGGE
jgi:hypothetical protein